MNKIVTESPNGLKVAITSYSSGHGAIEIETIDERNISWSMWFDHVEDMIFLANVLNDYIAEHNLRKETDNGENKEIKGLALIVAQYLVNYEPAENPNDMGMVIRSTEEIITDLADMADLNANVVANVMLDMGYTVVFLRDGRHGWAMKPR